MKRVISILLLSAMLLTSVACAENSNKKEEKDTKAPNADATEAIETTDEPDLPAVNLEGADFRIIYREGCSAYNEPFIYAEQSDGEPINDAIVERNGAASEKFNINIVGIGTTGVMDKMTKSIGAQDNEYDMGWDCMNNICSTMSKGYFFDLKSMANINLEAPWWDTNCANMMTFKNKLFFAVNDISMKTFANTFLIYYNKKLIADNNLTDPYDLLDSGTWTLENYLKMVQQVHEDLNGDGKMNKEDRFGLLREDGGSNSNFVHTLKGCDVPYTVANEEGLPEIALNTEKVVKLIEILRPVYLDDSISITYGKASQGADTSGFAHLYDYCRGALFTTDHFLFLQCGLDECDTMRNMESDYGFMPNPKFDENQTNYISGVDENGTAMVIPTTVTDIDAVGAIVEYLTWKSHYTVFPAYYEITIKGKRVRDERDEIACDIVKDSIRYEIADVMNFGISTMLWDGFKGNKFASQYEKKCKTINKKIEAAAKDFAEIQ